MYGLTLPHGNSPLQSCLGVIECSGQWGLDSRYPEVHTCSRTG